MKKQTIFLIIIGVLITSFGIGYAFAFIYQNIHAPRSEQKPAMEAKESELSVSADTQIIFEREYKCGHVLVSEFEHREALIGKTLQEIRKTWTDKNGYRIAWQDRTLVIHQFIDEWCPAEQEKCRLKVYQGQIAIYKGPDSQNDSLERVTAISWGNLPEDIQKAIEAGEYEFKNRQDLNDCLENLDEYF